MWKLGFLLLSCLVYQEAVASIIDVLQSYNGHEPSVAIKCGKVPFYVDPHKGDWVVDNERGAVCDKDKEEVKRYCQKVYPNLNISNVVEANKPVKLTEWCNPGQVECAEHHKVVPYRCLIDEYEADALLVPKHCRFGHLHDESFCVSHDEWRDRAAKYCKEKNDGMKLKDYGILLGCATDKFTGVEFVCCPHKHHKHGKKHHKAPIDTEKLSQAIEKLQKFLPEETAGCDRTAYSKKKDELEERHRTRIASVVDEWDEAESRYKKLKLRDIKLAEQKINHTLRVFRETLKDLEDEAKQERSRLRDEHAKCITVDINNKKRQTMLSYIASVEEKPHSAKKILDAVRSFIQGCEHDRLHSLRHFEHVRNQDPSRAASMRAGLLTHLQELNSVVNQSINLLTHLPDVASLFGLTSSTDGGVLKPRVSAPEPVVVLSGEGEASGSGESGEGSASGVSGEGSASKESDDSKMTVGTRLPTDDLPSDGLHKEAVKSAPVSNGFWEDLSHSQPIKNMIDQLEDDEHLGERAHQHKRRFFNHRSSPAAFAAVIGLSCGALVIILGSIIALVMRKRRNGHPHVVIATDDNDEREHLVKMQKNGYENPTYKFFYY